MDQYVPYVAVTTTLAAAGGAIAATIVSTLTSGKPDLTMIINGILAGLVSITAGCGNMTLVGSWVLVPSAASSSSSLCSLSMPLVSMIPLAPSPCTVCAACGAPW